MAEPIYESAQQALQATDEFYENQEGFQYTEELAKNWIKNNIKLPKKGKVLDLCCGDGIWSRGFQLLNPELELYGVDISQGGIVKAHKLLNSDDSHFKVCDAESELPFENGYFDIIFARGPGLYNQHSMNRVTAIKIIEMWHSKLKPISGRFFSIFSSTPQLMGSYTPMEKCKLPYNRSPRKTAAVDFSGGKYHHSIETFNEPFWAAKNVKVIDYSFKNNLHILVTSRM
jgi:SAM-dependent methyltransferase